MKPQRQVTASKLASGRLIDSMSMTCASMLLMPPATMRRRKTLTISGAISVATTQPPARTSSAAVKALAESRRVLRPGGRLALAVWDLPAKNAWLSAFVAAINEVSPPAAPPDPKALGPFRLCDRDQLEGFLRSAGFSGPSLESVPFSFEFDSGEGWWEFVFEIAAPVRNRILALDAGAQAKVRQLVLAQAEAYRSGGKIKLPAANLCAWAEK